MIDTLLAHRERALGLETPKRHGVQNGKYALLTLHRPSNVDDAGAFENLMTAISRGTRDLPVLFPVHPRTRPSLLQSPTARGLVAEHRLRLLEPLGYHEFIGLMAQSMVVLTDSGGAQEESTALGVPCLTLRDTTERPVTVTHGTNRVVGSNPDRIVAALGELGAMRLTSAQPPLWDGSAAVRIVNVLAGRLERQPALDATAASV